MTHTKHTAEKFVQTFNAHSGSDIKTLHATNVMFQAPLVVRLEGCEAVTGYAMTWLKGSLAVDNEVVSEPSLVHEFTLQGWFDQTEAMTRLGAVPELVATKR